MAEEAPLVEQVVISLEQATHMAKQLHTTTDPNHLLQIYTSLHQAHYHLSTFLSKTQFPPPPPLAANSLSSANGAAAAADDNDTEPMQLMDDNDAAVEEAEESSKGTLEKVEEKMRDCFIKNKRAKRPLSPSAVAEERGRYDDGYSAASKSFDPRATRLKALDLVYQFHGWGWESEKQIETEGFWSTYRMNSLQVTVVIFGSVVNSYSCSSIFSSYYFLHDAATYRFRRNKNDIGKI